MKPFKALVLSGGKGTRLRPLTFSMAKQLVPVANLPILHYVMNHLLEAGITDIGVIISPETGEAIQTSLKQWQAQQAVAVQLTFILQEAPAGLAHALKIAEPYVQDHPVAMYLGDNLVEDALLPMVEQFKQQQPDAAILLKSVDNPQAFGVATLDDATGAVKQLVEKPKNPPSDLALVGVYLFNPIIFKAVNSINPSARGELEITDAIQWLVDNGYRVQPTQMQGWWLDTGKKDDLLAANKVVLESLQGSKIEAQLENTNVNGKVRLAKGARLINSSIIGPVSIGPGAVITNATIGPNVSIGADCVITNVRMADSVILEGAELTNIAGVIQNSLVGQNTKVCWSIDGQSHQFCLGEENSWVVGS